MSTQYTVDAADVSAARLRAGISQAEAAKVLGAGLTTWRQWEYGRRGMPLAAWELWLTAVIADGRLPATDPDARWIRPSIRALL